MIANSVSEYWFGYLLLFQDHLASIALLPQRALHAIKPQQSSTSATTKQPATSISSSSYKNSASWDTSGLYSQCHYKYIYCWMCARNKYANQNWHIYHTYQIFDGPIWKIYRYMSHIWRHYHQTYYQDYCTHMWHISLKKYHFHIANTAHTAYTLYGIKSWGFCNMPNKTNCDIYFKCYCLICARNKYAHQIGHKYAIYTKYLMVIYVRCMCLYEVNGINHVTRSPEYYLPYVTGKMAATLQI